MTPTATDYSARITSPPDTVDDAHDFLLSVWAGRPDVSARDRMALETVLSELVSNVIQGNSRRPVSCELMVSVAADAVELVTSDTGEPMVEAPSGGSRMPAEMAEHGRGLALIGLLADSLTYSHEGSRNVWRVVRKRTSDSET